MDMRKIEWRVILRNNNIKPDDPSMSNLHENHIAKGRCGIPSSLDIEGIKDAIVKYTGFQTINEWLFRDNDETKPYLVGTIAVLDGKNLSCELEFSFV